MPTRRVTNRPSAAGASRRVKRAARPDHTPCVLPIHDKCSSELRAFHAKHPPANIHRFLKDAVENLREASGNFAEKRRTMVFETEIDRDMSTEQEIAELGKRVEKNLRGLVDLDQELINMKQVLQDIGEAEKQRGNGDGVQPVAEYLKKMKKARKAFKRRELKDRYGNLVEYVEFRTVVHALTNPTAPTPQRKDWFKKPMFICDAVATITDEEPVSSDEGETGERENEIEMVDRDEESDDEIQETSAKRSLKCVLTMRRFEEPVKGACGHVFEKTAIITMFKDYKKLKKPTVCPTSGCGKEINVNDLKDDPVTKSLVDAEIRRERQEQERAMINSDDESVPSRSKASKSNSGSKGKETTGSRMFNKAEDEEIPYGDEDAAEGTVEETVEDNTSADEEDGEGEDEEMSDSD
ncbi:hypothetical protein AA313_de0202479 [Arthrobotrys entomopaga]|nr:hypothetical protein AA313_de0202479 [Arthrobotrys entomopaga]